MPLAFAFALTGCAYRIPETHVPTPIADEVATSPIDITVDAARGEVDSKTAQSVRDDTVAILAGAGARPRDAGARMHVHVRLVARRDANDALNEDGFAVFGLWPVVFGMVCERQELTVDVTIDADGRAITGHGAAEKLGGIYAPARRRALAVALDAALADAARKTGVSL